MFKYTIIIYEDTVSQENYLPFPATALIPDNILNELKEVNWKIVGGFHGVLDLPESVRERIKRMYVSEEERKSAGVLWWVDHHPRASWRLLITQLDYNREHSLANRIHQYAEKVTGMLSSIVDSYKIPYKITYLILIHPFPKNRGGRRHFIIFTH